MPIFPLSQTLNDSALLKTTCHLYRISLSKVLPLSALFVLILHYFRYGKAYLPLAWQPYFLQSAMVLIILSLPVVGAIIGVIDKVAKEQPYTLATVAIETGNRFLSLMGALISMALLPLILLGVCYAAYFYLMAYLHLNPHVLFAWTMLTPLLIFATVVTKMYAPWLIFSDHLDANEAQDTSSLLVKHNYFKCFIHGLFATLVIVLLIKLPGLLAYYLPSINALPPIAGQLIADLLLMFTGSWTLSFLLTDKHNLQLKKGNLSSSNQQGTRKVKVPRAIPKNSDNVSF